MIVEAYRSPPWSWYSLGSASPFTEKLLEIELGSHCSSCTMGRTGYLGQRARGALISIRKSVVLRMSERTVAQVCLVHVQENGYHICNVHVPERFTLHVKDRRSQNSRPQTTV